MWGFVLSTVVLWHGTIIDHFGAPRLGIRRFETGDDSRNNFFLALNHLGEGWTTIITANVSARQGIRWWEIDATFSL
jgi:stearoyl-CoA desaturase (delta-9 desaturase)